MAVLLAWNCTSDFAPSTQASGFTGATISTVAGGLVRASPGYSTDPIAQYIGPSGSTTVANAVTNSSYLEFGFTGVTGTFDITSVTWNGARGGGGTPRGYALRSSLDSYAADLQTADYATQRPTFAAITVDLSGNGSFQGLSANVVFRMFLYHPNGVSVEQDDITINGTTGGGGGASAFPHYYYQQLRK